MAIQLMTNRFEVVNKRIAALEKRIKRIEDDIEPDEIITTVTMSDGKDTQKAQQIVVNKPMPNYVNELASMLEQLQKKNMVEV